MMQIFVFIFGVLIGSFLNAVIWRTKIGKSIVKGRSQCVHCDRSLKARDLVPLFSFLVQGGNCRYCHKSISWQYPLIEVITGLLFILAFQMGTNVSLPRCIAGPVCVVLPSILNLFIISILIVLGTLDFRYLLLPARLSIGAALVVFITHIMLGIPWYNLFVAGFIGFSFFAIQYFISKGRWVGNGDMYMGAFMGVVLGFPKIFSAIFFSYMLGAVVAIVLLSTGRASRGAKLPLGTFLAIGTYIVMMWGEKIMLIVYKFV